MRLVSFTLHAFDDDDDVKQLDCACLIGNFVIVNFFISTIVHNYILYSCFEIMQGKI